LRAFFDVKTTLGFVIDDTGSMGTEIAGVASSIQQIIGYVTQGSKPREYLLLRFNDPYVGSAVINDNPYTILEAVRLIRPNGGGDCPELSQTGLLRAIAAAKRGSTLYLYTDATAKDAHLSGNVSAAANAKQISINYALTGSCSPIDPAYLTVAQNTGGQAFIINPSETSKLFALMKPSLSGDLQPILVINAPISNEMTDFTVPVDDSMYALTLSISADSLQRVEVSAPNGSTIDSNTPDVEMTTMSGGRVITIQSPMPGTWSVRASGSGALRFSALGNSPKSLSGFAFVELRGRPEHEGYFPISGMPLMGENAVGRATGNAGFSEFVAVGLDGTPITTLPLISDASEGTLDDEYVGAFVTPTQPFRIYARGLDSNGNAIQRVYPEAFSAQDIKVVVTEAREIAPGEAKDVVFEVSNLGAERTVHFTSTDSLGSANSLPSPQSSALGPGQTLSVRVPMSVPPESAVAEKTILLVAEDANDRTKRNHAQAKIQIGERDSDGDGFRDSVDECPISDMRATINIGACDTLIENHQIENGCNMADRIAQLRATANNHGQFVRSVAAFTQQQRDANLITGRAMGAIQSCAARSN
jgi:von Willebrand factor A domain-containing protein 7